MFQLSYNRAKRLFPKDTEEDIREKAFQLMLNGPRRPEPAPLPPPPSTTPHSARVDNATLANHIPLNV
jgi:hypothetical protein